MKKIILCAGILLANNFAAQELSNLMRGGQNDEELSPNVNPPSPESYFRTQYGNLQFNEFKGNPNVDIPIHTMASNRLKHPISLKYGKAGVKVNDTPNSLGMNWVFEAGGVINRTIYDKADEVAGQRLLLSLDDMTYLYSNAGEQTLADYARDLSSQYDHQPDVFNFSFPGYSGSFYLGANFQPVLITQNNDLKIETVGIFKQTYTFIITTNDGTKYTFGGTGAIEKTWVRANAFQSGITSFYLTKIENVAGNRIDFTYSTLNANVTLLGLSELISIKNTLYDQGPADGNGTSSPSTTPYTQLIKKINIQDPKILTQITSGSEKVTINYTTGASEPFQKIGNIVISSHSIDTKKIVFDYINYSSNDPQKRRFFLEKIKEYALKNNQETFVQEYKLEYDDPLGLPERLTNTTDYLGYYNGTSNPNTLLPNLNLFGDQYVFFNQNPYYYADRRPGFNFAKKGTLTSIMYPTKGKTVFEYEPISARSPVPVAGEIFQAIGNTEPLYVAESLIDYNTVASMLPLSNEFVNSLPSSELMGNKIKVEIKLHSNLFNTNPNKAKAQFDIVDQASGQVVYTQKIFIIKTAQYADFTADYIIEPNKTYQFKFRIVDNTCIQCSGTAVIKYPKEDEWQIVQNGNIRLKRQYDTSENGTVNSKRIYYTDYKNINAINSIDFLYKPDFTSYRFDQKTYAPQTGPGGLPSAGNVLAGSILETIVNSEMQAPIVYASLVNDDNTFEEYSYSIYDPIYPNVSISYGGDDFEKGGEEKRFSTQYNLNSYTFRPPSNDQGLMFSNSLSDLNTLAASAQNNLFWDVPVSNLTGKLISHRVFKKKNNLLYLKTTTKNNYNPTLVGTVSSVYGVTLYPLIFIPSGINVGTYLNNMYIGGYRLPSYATFLDSSISKEYLEDVSVNVSDDSSYKKLITTTNYLYDNVDKQLSKSTTQFSDMRVQETTYKYAREKANQRLINSNMLGIPLETESKKNGQTLSKTETKYDNVANLFPSSVISSDLQNSIPYTEVTYEKYDAKGNLQQYKTKDGTSVSIVWGYNNTQPIAKIEGITYDALVQAAGSQLSAAIAASDTDASATAGGNEDTLLSKLNDLRMGINGFGPITTYTYDPLIGVRSITQPSEVQELYMYDAANRLKEIKQKEVSATNVVSYKIVKEFEYHYKN